MAFAIPGKVLLLSVLVSFLPPEIESVKYLGLPDLSIYLGITLTCVFLSNKERSGNWILLIEK